MKINKVQKIILLVSCFFISLILLRTPTRTIDEFPGTEFTWIYNLSYSQVSFGYLFCLELGIGMITVMLCLAFKDLDR